MQQSSRSVTRVYLSLTFLNTLAASLIWGINTLFLLDAGLSNSEAFAANAFFTVGQVIFEVPTGVVADSRGRRFSFLLGTVTLSVSTLLYLWMWKTSGPFWGWALTSIFLGLGFTFFSGATEAWLVDALKSTNFDGALDSVFAKAQTVGGIAMLGGSVSGGVIAQHSDLGVPYALRAAILGVSFVVAFLFMRDVGFTPDGSRSISEQMRGIVSMSLKRGLGEPRIRWVMLAAPFASGVGFYAFYAMQPYLLKLYGDPSAYSVAGAVAAIMAGAQIIGGVAAPTVRKLFSSRLSLLLTVAAVNSVLLVAVGMVANFWIAIALIVAWAVALAASTPVRQSYLNELIPSDQRATVLSFDSLMGSSGGVVIQPVLGRAADVWGYATSYLIGAAIHALSFPFLLLARRAESTALAIRSK